MTMGLVHAAKQIEAQGRGPDTSLAHISPDESAMLDYMQGGRRMNPVTGLPEYSLFGKILKAVAKIGASTVGFMYGGPMGAAAASAAVSKLTGDSWKSALTTGAVSGLTSGIGSYAQGVGKGASGLSRLGEIATTSGNTIAAGALAPAVNFSPLTGPGANTISEAVKTGALAAPTGLGVLAPSNIINAGYGAAGAAVGAAIPTKGTPATPLPMPYQEPYDPKNVPSWMRRPSQQQQIAVSPMNTYQNYAPEMQTYADGGDVAPVGMGLPQSAAIPQLMSAAQWGYVNARAGGRINGPGDGKSDDIPAMLSVDENVFDAATVSAAGNGSSKAGHEVMQLIKEEIRRQAGQKNPKIPTKGIGFLVAKAKKEANA